MRKSFLFSIFCYVYLFSCATFSKTPLGRDETAALRMVDYRAVVSNPEIYLNRTITMRNIQFSTCNVEEIRMNIPLLPPFKYQTHPKNLPARVYFLPYVYEGNRVKILFRTKRLYGRNTNFGKVVQKGFLKKFNVNGTLINQHMTQNIEQYCNVKLDEDYYVFFDAQFFSDTSSNEDAKN